MFNSPIFDIALGLIFIFLLYSLLATSVNETISMVLDLRARMLRNAITERMLSNVVRDNRWMSLWKGIRAFFTEITKMLTGSKEKTEEEKKIGDKFFDHPLIKNYGSSRIFPLPSYIPSHNFSTVLFDVLKQEFNQRIDEIADYKFSLPSNQDTRENIRERLQYNTDIRKIKEIVDYYGRHYSTPGKSSPPLSVIDRDTWQILHLHLEDSLYQVDKFTQKIEGWFDDSMNRVSGWYKRQTQVVLFMIGISLAIILNIDPIEISGKLSIDKDARDKLVQLAMEASDKYKDDSRVRKVANNTGEAVPDSSTTSMQDSLTVDQAYQIKMNNITKRLMTDAENANGIIALGWGDYGKKNEKATVLEKVWYVIKQSLRGRKLLGLLITAFAISLGAPFWFDLLNKMVRLRAAGKKEESDKDVKPSLAQPVIVQVNTQPGEEAVG